MSTTTKPRHAKPTLQQGLPERRYLPELHGIRGLALAGVVLFHLFGNGRVSGGIDIFLAVSGFLFTGMLLREAATTGGQIDPLKYYGRLVRRILVPAALVVVATLTAGLLISPVTKHSQLWAEARASLLYFENIELINSQLAYGAAGPETSPFQHFWSLSVQGQFYIIWPVLAMVSVLIAKRLHKSAAAIMTALVTVVLVVSFVYAIYVGSFNQDANYLMTTTRAWQLAFGGLLALAGGTIRLPQPLRAPAGWLGLALIVSTGFVLDGGQQFPGPWALYPLAGLTLVLISAGPLGGNHDPKHTATRFLSNKPLAWIGDHAYGLYLWHWPLLIYYLELRDREAIGWRGGLVILAITVVLAILTYRYIEQPLKQRQSQHTRTHAHRMNKTVVAAAAGFLLVAGTGSTLVLHQPQDHNAPTIADIDPDYPGAAQYFTSENPPAAEPFPSIEDIEQYFPDYATRGCGQGHGQGPGKDEVMVCDDQDAPEDPTATVVLAGGSHAGHLEAAFKNLGHQHGWEVLVVTKSRCDFGIEEQLPDSMCDAWSSNFVDWLTERDVDLVVTPGTRLDEPEEYVLDLAPTWWQRISDTGTDLLVVRGMPRGDHSVPECLAEGGTSQECGLPKDRFAETNPLLSIDLPEHVHPVDVSQYVCPQLDDPAANSCDAIVGNIIVSYDTNHLTSVFSHTLGPAFETEMRDTVGWLFD